MELLTYDECARRLIRKGDLLMEYYGWSYDDVQGIDMTLPQPWLNEMRDRLYAHPDWEGTSHEAYELLRYGVAWDCREICFKPLFLTSDAKKWVEELS